MVSDRLYAEVTARVIAELEEGRLPWVRPWDAATCPCTMPANAVTGRRYSGINVLILWSAVIEGQYASQRWLTYKQAQAAGGNVRKGERGTTICYADRFTPKEEAERARDEDREARQLAFLKRFTVFNVDQCEGLPERFTPQVEVGLTYAMEIAHDGKPVKLTVARAYRPAFAEEMVAAALAPVAVTPQLSVADELAKLGKLKTDGFITQDEFSRQKAKLLAR